ncbi:hypothetical protein ACTUVN_003757 [Pseudomonas caspiana]
MVIQSLNLEQALLKDVVQLGSDVSVGESVRFIPTEDSGLSSGPIVIGSRSILRDGAIICSGVTIGEDSVIGHQCVVRARVTIGNSSVVSHLVCLERDATIGSHVRISALTHITGGCEVGDHVQIGARVVTVNDNEMRWREGEKLQAAKILDGAKIGSGVTLLGHVIIGKGAFVGAGAVVTKSVANGQLVYGNPAYVQGEAPSGDWLAGASRSALK